MSGTVTCEPLAEKGLVRDNQGVGGGPLLTHCKSGYAQMVTKWVPYLVCNPALQAD